MAGVINSYKVEPSYNSIEYPFYHNEHDESRHWNFVASDAIMSLISESLSFIMFTL